MANQTSDPTPVIGMTQGQMSVQ